MKGKRLTRLLSKFTRQTFLSLVLILVFLLLLTSSARLQLNPEETSEDQLPRGSVRQLEVSGARGDIVDRNGIVLAATQKTSQLYLANAGLGNDELNAMLLDLANMLDSYEVSYGREIDKYLDLETSEFAMSLEDILAWQKNPNYLALEDLPRGTKSDYRDKRYTKTTPESFLDFLVQTKFGISQDYTLAEQLKILRLRFDIYLNNWLFSQGKPILLAKDIPADLVLLLEEQNFRFQGTVVAEESARVYPEDSIYAAHVIGYLGQISPEEYEKLSPHGYRPEDLAGKSGVELTAERFLKGKTGYKPFNIWSAEGAEGSFVSELSNAGTVSGDQVKLTLDMAVQRAGAEKINELIDIYNSDSEFEGFPESTGAAVMLDLKNKGAVLAMISLPTFAPQDFMDAAGDEEAAARVAQYLTDSERLPLLNRAISLPKAPGSTFKVVTAAALLDTGVVNPQTTVFCPGYIDIDGMRFRCEDEHGLVDLDHAIAYSCNVYFYAMGVEMGIDSLARTSEWLGLAEKTGIEISGEAQGVVASPTSKQLYQGENDTAWFPADTAQSAIGQGLNAYTVLQLARATGGIATGELVSPYIIEEIRASDDTVTLKAKQEAVPVPLEPADLSPVRHAMLQMTTDEKSTVRGFFEDAGYFVAGKTGTAETVVNGHGLTTDGLFVAFAPYEDPEVAVAVMVETGARGAPTAEVARRMLDAYFSDEEYEIGIVSNLSGIK